jgi:aryl-alcohol dehydrogenase-like predicted oxidoreductase
VIAQEECMVNNTCYSPSRRSVAAGFGVGLLHPSLVFAQTQGPLLTRPIPHGGNEALPAVGVGTVKVFDVGTNAQDRTGPTAVVRALVAGGGSLIDTAPSYGNAESVVGDILSDTGLRPRAIIATKLERYQRGQLAAEAHESLQRLKINKIDVLQLHNVRDPNQDMGELNDLKSQGLCRYTGITTTFEGRYAAAESVIQRTKPDFLEIDYAINNRDAEQRVLPAARNAGTAVLIALPFGRGRLFRLALGKKLPDWAAEIDCTSWGQFFLKYLLGNPVVTAVIPGTDKPEHMVDNLGAGHGRLPDPAMRTRMVQYVESLG